MKEIVLARAAGEWITETYVNGEPDPESLNLFGSHVLPTPFGADTSGREVLERIQLLNPDASVRVRA